MLQYLLVHLGTETYNLDHCIHSPHNPLYVSLVDNNPNYGMCMHLSVIRPSPKKLKTKTKSFRRGAIISAILRNFGQVRHSRVIDALTGRTIDDQPGADVRKSPLWFQVGEILSGNDALTSMPLRSSLLMVFDDYCLWG